MTLRSRLHALQHLLADAVYTPMCSECNRRGVWACEVCRAKVRQLQGPGCERCGVVLASACECARLPDEIELLRSAYPYAGWVRSSIHRFKYNGEFARSETLAAEFDRVRADIGAVDAVVPVPIHLRRLRQRGFNQSLLLARHVASAWDISCADILQRQVDNPRQVGRTLDERWRNVTGIFACTNAPAVRGKRVAVLDDVITTGATISSCAVALAAAGAQSVVGISAARG